MCPFMLYFVYGNSRPHVCIAVCTIVFYAFYMYAGAGHASMCLCVAFFTRMVAKYHHVKCEYNQRATSGRHQFCCRARVESTRGVGSIHVMLWQVLHA